MRHICKQKFHNSLIPFVTWKSQIKLIYQLIQSIIWTKTVGYQINQSINHIYIPLTNGSKMVHYSLLQNNEYD